MLEKRKKREQNGSEDIEYIEIENGKMVVNRYKREKECQLDRIGKRMLVKIQ